MEHKNSTPHPNNSSKVKAPLTNPAPALKTLAGVVERITFQAADTGYTVARLLPDYPSPHSSGSSGSSQRGFVKQANGDDNLVTIVGTLTGVAVGEALDLSGYWQQHSQHGWQFKVENYRSVLPAATQGIRKYLGSGLIKGIGPKTAEKIVAHFDVETLDVLEANPDRLNEVPKLGPHKARLIGAAWVEQKAIKEVMVFLQGQGVSTSLAVRIYKQYKDGAITIVKNEPYRLAREVWGIGFKTADKIAQSLGFTQDDPERIKAGTLFVLGEASDSGGHTYLPRPHLSTKAAELLEVSEAQVDEAITGLALDGGAKVETLVADPDDGSFSFEPLVSVTFFNPAQNSNQSQNKNQGQGFASNGISSKPIERPYSTPKKSQPQPQPQPRPELVPVANREAGGEPAPASDGLMVDLDEALRYSPNYKRIAPTTATATPTSYPYSQKGTGKSVTPENNTATAKGGQSNLVESLSSASHSKSLDEKEKLAREDWIGSLELEGAEVSPQPGAGAKPPSKPMILGNGATPTLSALPGEQAVYLPPFYFAEQGIAKNLLRLYHSPRAKDALADMAHTDFKAMFDYLATKDLAKLQLAERQ